MFFASKNSVEKWIVAKPAQVVEGLAKQEVGGGSCHSQGTVRDKEFCYLFRLGVSGKKSNSGRGRNLKGIKQGDIVVLEFAGSSCNYDWKAVSEAPCAQHLPLTGLPAFRGLYADAISQLRTIGARPVILSLPELLPQRYFDFVSRGLNKVNILKWLGGDINKLSDWHEQFSHELFKLGGELNVPVVNIGSLLLNCRSLGDCYGSDGMHPNKRGYALIAESVIPSCLV